VCGSEGGRRRRRRSSSSSTHPELDYVHGTSWILHGHEPGGKFVSGVLADRVWGFGKFREIRVGKFVSDALADRVGIKTATNHWFVGSYSLLLLHHHLLLLLLHHHHLLLLLPSFRRAMADISYSDGAICLISTGD